MRGEGQSWKLRHNVGLGQPPRAACRKKLLPGHLPVRALQCIRPVPGHPAGHGKGSLLPTAPRPWRLEAAIAAGLLALVTISAPCSADNSTDALTIAAEQVGPGSTGPAVVILQHTLDDWGLDAPVDGNFGATTAGAVATAARQVGISVSDLMTQLAVIGFGPRAIQMGAGDQGPSVAALQRALTRAGHGVGSTGVFGPQTEAEVRAFQQAQGLPVTGQITIWEVERTVGGTGGASAPESAPALAPAATQPSAESSSLREDVTQFAASLNGEPYAWGGSGPSAFDCSGLTRYVLGAVAGTWLPHSSYLQWLWGKPVASGYLRPGDLVFFNADGPGPSHVGIYIGGPAQDFVDATTPSGGVQIDSLYNTYWGRHYIGGRSVLP